MGLFTRKQAEKKSTAGTADRRLPLKPGTSVDLYLIESVLGAGGFSIVYRCFDIRESESMVLKEYFPHQLARRTDDDNIEPLGEKTARAFQVGMQQFFAEARALAQIDHPNVINIVNVFRTNNSAYMVSALETGKDLRWLIKRSRGKPLDQAFVQKAIPPIMSGINALHRNNLLHLDIKPGNIFLRTNGQPLLLDFGASKTMDKKERFSSFQTLTPGFAAPEQHRKQQLGPESDIYALGATIYACITGRPPPTSLKREEKGNELNLKGVGNRIPRSVIDAIRWALEMDVNKRPRTLEEFADLFMQDSDWPSFAAFEADLLKHHRERQAKTG